MCVLSSLGTDSCTSGCIQDKFRGENILCIAGPEVRYDIIDQTKLFINKRSSVNVFSSHECKTGNPKLTSAI